jgi:hypothetical protein
VSVVPLMHKFVKFRTASISGSELLFEAIVEKSSSLKYYQLRVDTVEGFAVPL